MQTQPNPWADLPASGRRVLSCERPGVSALESWCHRRGAAATHRHWPQTQLFPDPFIGWPDAPVVIVLANPGYTDDARASAWSGCTGSDDWWHANSEAMKECYRANLRHAPLPYPMFFLDPRLPGSPGGVYYRTRLLKQLRLRFDDETLANAITTVVFYPYHTRRSRAHPPSPFPRGGYPIYLIQSAIERGATMVVMRCRKLLESAIPDLRNLNYVTSASRNAAVSPGNLVSRSEAHQGRLRADRLSD